MCKALIDLLGSEAKPPEEFDVEAKKSYTLRDPAEKEASTIAVLLVNSGSFYITKVIEIPLEGGHKIVDASINRKAVCECTLLIKKAIPLFPDYKEHVLRVPLQFHPQG